MHCTSIKKSGKLPDIFLHLANDDRKAILDKAAHDSGKGANVLEKDVWVCWTLEKLVAMPGVPPLAFKGGTSLSKVYNAIARFSEDVDVTLDRRALDSKLDPFADKSRTQRKKDCDALDALLNQMLTEQIKPYFDECLRAELGDKNLASKFGENHGQLVIPYPSCFDRGGAYMPESILLELGGKNSIEPAIEHELSSYLESHVPSVEYPKSKVPVLTAERTFWEKATLVHAECNRPKVRENVDRMSRHWYDLAQLSKGAVGTSAMDDKTLLEDVVTQKNTLYYSGFANYEECLTGGLRLVPDESLANALGEDFGRMEADGMFWQPPGDFSDILAQLGQIEAEINEKFTNLK